MPFLPSLFHTDGESANVGMDPGNGRPLLRPPFERRESGRTDGRTDGEGEGGLDRGGAGENPCVVFSVLPLSSFFSRCWQQQWSPPPFFYLLRLSAPHSLTPCPDLNAPPLSVGKKRGKRKKVRLQIEIARESRTEAVAGWVPFCRYLRKRLLFLPFLLPCETVPSHANVPSKQKNEKNPKPWAVPLSMGTARIPPHLSGIKRGVAAAGVGVGVDGFIKI